MAIHLFDFCKLNAKHMQTQNGCLLAQQRQIRLNQMSEETEGFIDGSLAALDKKLGGLGKKDPKFVGKLKKRVRDMNNWTNGFYKGYYDSQQKINKIKFKIKVQGRETGLQAGLAPNEQNNKNHKAGNKSTEQGFRKKHRSPSNRQVKV